MNNSNLVKLIALINGEIRTFHQLLELLQEEQKAIVDDDIESIQRSVVAQESLALHAKELEVQRIQLVAEVAKDLDLGEGNVTLAKLMDVLEGPQSEELGRMRATVMKLNQRIRETNENNAFLIRQSVRYTERCIDILAGQPIARGMYGQSGRVRGRGSRRSVLNQTG